MIDRPAKPLAGPTIAALLIASAQAPLGSTQIAVALPSISLGLGADLVLTTGLLVTAYLVVNVVGQGPGGKLSDLLGHPRTLRIGMLLYAIGALIGLFAPGVSLLLVSRCTMAAAGALVVPATLALLRLHVPPERRGRVFGLFGATMGFAAAMGPALGGELVSLFGWRAIFVASLPFLGLAALLLHFYPLPPSRVAAARTAHEAVRAFDVPGVALFAGALTALILATKEDGALRVALLAAGLAIAAAFLVWESRAREPVFDLRLFRQPAFAAGTSITALQNFAMYGLLFQLPQYFEHFRATPPRDVGYMLFAMMIGMVFASPLGGRLSDRIGARRSALWGALPLLAGSLWLCRLANFTSAHDALAPLLLFGIGLGLCSAPVQSSSMSSVGPQHAGMAAGVSSTMRYLGGIASILVMGVVLGSNAVVSVDRHTHMTWIFASAIVISTVISLRLPQGGPPPAEH